MNYIVQQLTGKKVVLFASLSGAVLADLFVTLMLLGYGMPFASYVIPLALTVIDAAFLLLSVFTNFKFTYSIKYTVIYSALFGIASVVYALLNTEIFADAVVYTYVAIGFWLAAHVLALVSSVAGAARAGADGSDNRTGAAICLALSLIVTVSYGAFAISGGVFGQGKAQQARPVAFTLDEAHGYYVATSADMGKGGTVTVPASFNGKPVGAIDCTLFAASGVDEVIILSDTSPKLINTEMLSAASADIKISAKKTAMTELVHTLVDIRTEGSLALAGRVVPSDLAEDEVYVTFAYSLDTLDLIDELMPVWIAKKGTAFDLSFASDVSYALNSDRNDEQLLAALYTENTFGGSILRPLAASGEALVGKRIDKSITGVEIAFDKIYNVTFMSDNDELYELPAEYTGLTSGRYVIADTADMIIESAPTRQGFELLFISNGKIFTDIGEVIAEASDQRISINPMWNLLPPTVSYAKNDLSGNAIYGNSVTFSAEAISPADGVNIRYTWSYSGENLASESSFTIPSIGIDSYGVYEVVCEAYSDTVTSLTSRSSATVSVAVDPRPIGVSFNEFTSGGYTKIYDARTAYVGITYDTSTVVGQDAITYEFSEDSLMDAGTYTVTVSLTGDAARKYRVIEPTCTYTIDPREVTLEWDSVRQYVYTAAQILPACTVSSGIQGSDTVNVTVSSAASVSVGDYVATAAVDNANYVIRQGDESIDFEITKAPLSVVWNEASLSVVYNGKDTNKPTVTVLDGAQGGDVPVSSVTVTNPGKNVGTYTAKAALTADSVNRNYYIAENSEVSFAIIAKEITVSWADTSMIYNGSAGRLPTPVFSGLVASDSAMASVISNTDAKNVGTYSATVTVANTNYRLIGSNETQFSIGAAQITLMWGNSTLTYNGTEQAPTVTIASGVCGTDSFTVSVSGKVKDADDATHIATATLVSEGGSLTSNYTVKNTTCGFTVGKKRITLTWEGLTVTYNGTVQTPTATVFGAIEGDNVGLTVSGAKKDAGEHKVQASVANTNYVIDAQYVNATLTVLKKAITVLWGTTSFVYDGNAHQPTPTVESGVVSGDSVTLSVTGKTAVNVGTYTVTAASDNANYSVGTGAGCEFTVTQKEITVSFVDLIYTYSGKLIYPEISTLGVIDGEDAQIHVNGGTDAGEYTVTVTVGNKNYKLSAQSASTATLKIEKAPVTLSFGETDLTYSGAVQYPEISVASGNVTGEKLSLTVSGTGKSAGSYTATVSLDHKNYYIDGTSTVAYTIAAKEISLTWQALTFVYDGGYKLVTPTVTGIIAGDDALVTVSGGGTLPGTYELAVSVGNPDYRLADGEDGKAQLVIEKATVTVELDTLTFVYDGKAHKPTPYVTSGLIGGDTVSFTVNTSGGVSAGTYTVTVTLDDERYALVSDVVREFTVTPAPVSVLWSDNGTTGASFTDVNGERVALTVKYYAVIEGARVELDAAPTEPGRYVAVASVSEYTDYSFTLTEYEFEIITGADPLPPTEDDEKGEEQV